MKRPVVLFVAVIALVVAASGCSIKEVQLWFQVHQNKAVPADQAKTIADAINAHQAAGCDPFYSANGALASTCVPNNVASVHCAGSDGDGPSVMGPLKVGAYDPFDLDKDGDKAACVDPVGSIDVLGQVLDTTVHIAGWTFDPNTTDPIHITVTDNGVDTDQIANGARADINAAFPGVGTTHGFDLTVNEASLSTHRICVTAKNVAAGSDQKLGCKTIQLQPTQSNADGGHDIEGLIEGADRVPGGIHIRGYAFDGASQNTVPAVGYGAVEDPTVVTSLTGKQTVDRPDVVSDFSLTGSATYGFDFVVPVTDGSTLASTSSVCLYDTRVPATNVQLMCRAINS